MKLTNYNDIDISSIAENLKKVSDEILTDYQSLLDETTIPTWANFAIKMETISEKFDGLAPISHLVSVDSSDELQEEYEKCLDVWAEHRKFFRGNMQYYNKVKIVLEDTTLTTDQRTAIEKSVESMERAGIDLPEDKQKILESNSKRLSILSNDFSKNILGATAIQETFIYIPPTDKNMLDGIPKDSMEFFADRALNADYPDGWLIGLDMSSYSAVMTYADSASLRSAIYYDYVTRASKESALPEYDNTEIMNEILALKHNTAEVLGFNNYAELSISTKMAESIDSVLSFLEDLREKSCAKAEADMKELREYVGTDLDPWDISYYTEKLLKEKYDVDENEIKQYFPYQNVIDGLFNVADKLFGIECIETVASVWHPDVKFYRVFKHGELIAGFYMDLFARTNKRDGAWMGGDTDRCRKENGDIQLPIANIICNFTPLVNGRSLLSHREMETIFHEFGHAMHHMLTEVEVSDLSGINGVEWDAVELPSQLMENWCWDFDTLEGMSELIGKTGEKFPRTLFDKMIKAKYFMSGTQLHRQLMMSIFDFKIHMEKDPDVRKILKETENSLVRWKGIDANRFENSFSHIFAGGYAAGYMSYLAAEVLSADVFSRFEGNGIYDKHTAEKYLECILSKGGSKSMAFLFQDFMGRNPSVDALLKDRGID